MDFSARLHPDMIPAIAEHLPAHEAVGLRLVCKSYNERLATSEQRDALRLRSRDEQRSILDKFVAALPVDDRRPAQPLDVIAERIEASAPPGPAVLHALETIPPELFVNHRHAEIARRLLPFASAAKNREILSYFSNHPDEAAKFVGLSHLAAVAEHLPPAALGDLRAHIGPIPDPFFLAGIAQLHRGFAGDAESAPALRTAVINGVFAAPGTGAETVQLRATLAGVWNHLDSAQRRAVAQAAAEALRITVNGYNELAAGGLLNLEADFRVFNTREAARAVGAKVAAFPLHERTQFLQILSELPHRAHVATVDALGPEFHAAFPECFTAARARAEELLNGGWPLSRIPIALRPHETCGVPEALRNHNATQLAAAPAFDAAQLFAPQSPPPTAPPPDTRPLPNIANLQTDPLVRTALLDVAHISKRLEDYSPIERMQIVDGLAATNRFGDTRELLYTGMGRPLQNRLLDHVRRLLDRDDPHVTLPPLHQFSPEALADALDGEQFERWRAVNDRQRMLERRNQAALALNEHLPQIQRSATPSIAALNEAANHALFAEIANAATRRQSGRHPSARTASLLDALKAVAPKDETEIPLN